MNLPSQVFKPAVSLFSSVKPSVYEARGRLPAEQLGVTQLSYQQAYERALEEGKRLGLTAAIGELYYSFEYNFYGAGFGQHDTEAHGKSWLFFHGTDGRFTGAGNSRARYVGRALLSAATADPWGQDHRGDGSGADCAAGSCDRDVVCYRDLYMVAQVNGQAKQ